MTTNLCLIITIIIVIFISMSLSVADESTSTDDPYDNPIKITPTTILILVSILAVFFLMSCLSFYLHRCVDYGGAAGGTTLDQNRQFNDGLDQAIIGSFPTFLYSEVRGLKIGKGELECAVCICEFEDMDTLRLLPKCSHVFHKGCIDTWLNNNVTCPVCRAMLVLLPGETNDFVLPLHEPEVLEQRTSCHLTDGDIIIDIQSPEPANRSQTPKQSPPPRSTSGTNRLFGMFNRSFTTGHVVVQPGDDNSRFTLRLPEEVRNKLVSRSPSQAQVYAILPRERSKRNCYRSASVGATKGRGLFNFERFEPEGNPDRWRSMKTPSIFSRSGSARSPKYLVENSEAQQLGNTPKGLLRSIVKSPVSSTLLGTNSTINENVNVGERSFDRLIRFDGHQA